MSEDFKYKYHPSEVQKILNEISTSQDIRSKLEKIYLIILL